MLAEALTGRATGAVACTVAGEPALRGAAAAAALTTGLRLDWGRCLGAVAVAAGRPGGRRSRTPRGWRYAHWLVSHASEHRRGAGTLRRPGVERTDGKWQPVTGDAGAGNGTVVAEVFS